MEIIDASSTSSGLVFYDNSENKYTFTNDVNRYIATN